MIEYSLLILGIGLIVYNVTKLVLSAIDQFAAFMASRDIKAIKALAEKQDNEEEKTSC